MAFYLLRLVDGVTANVRLAGSLFFSGGEAAACPVLSSKGALLPTRLRTVATS